MSKKELLQNPGDFFIGALGSGVVDHEALGKMVDAYAHRGDDLSWEAPEGPARMGGLIFINAADMCRGNERKMQELAESYNQMFGIPTQEAVRRIKLAGEKF